MNRPNNQSNLKKDPFVDFIQFQPVSKLTVESAKNLVLSGLKEHWGTIDNSLNPDLYAILEHYIAKGDDFIVGVYDKQVICCGALTKESQAVGRMQRISVDINFRGKGLASKIVDFLEKRAHIRGFKIIVVETTKTWDNAIQLYLKNGYKEYNRDEEDVHLEKILE